MARPRLLSDEQILAATRATVLELGPQVSVDTVAERLSVTAPALLKRFGSRDALWLAALKPPDELPFRDVVMAGPREGEALLTELERMLELFFDFFSEMVPRVSALRESGIDFAKATGFKPGFDGMLRALRAWIDRAVELGLVQTPDVDTAAMAIVGALQFRAFHAHLTKKTFTTRANRAHITELALLFARALAPLPVARGRARRTLNARNHP